MKRREKRKDELEVMFSVGDNISYPMHGAGRVEAIQKRKDDESNTVYYELHFYADELKIMVPVEKALEVGMRPVISTDEAELVFQTLTLPPCKEDSNWNRRHRANLDKLRLGTPLTIAEVLRALSVREQTRGLSAGEKKMLNNARRFLLGELYLAGCGSEEDLGNRIDRCLLAQNEDSGMEAQAR